MLWNCCSLSLMLRQNRQGFVPDNFFWACFIFITNATQNIVSPLTYSAQIINTKFCKMSVNVRKIGKSIHSWVDFSKFIWYLFVILLIQNTTQTQLNHHTKLFFPCCRYCRKIKENVCSEIFSGVVEPLKLMAKVKKIQRTNALAYLVPVKRNHSTCLTKLL